MCCTEFLGDLCAHFAVRATVLVALVAVITPETFPQLICRVPAVQPVPQLQDNGWQEHATPRDLHLTPSLFRRFHSSCVFVLYF